MTPQTIADEIDRRVLAELLSRYIRVGWRANYLGQPDENENTE